MATTTIHMCVSISGLLRWKTKDLAGCLTDNGYTLSGKEVRDRLMYEQAMGKKVLPIGEPCEGFSYQTGCPGHEDTE